MTVGSPAKLTLARLERKRLLRIELAFALLDAIQPPQPATNLEDQATERRVDRRDCSMVYFLGTREENPRTSKTMQDVVWYLLPTSCTTHGRS